ncbi:hypothetical protein B0J12DRAFT_100758 [Macrophomina phaseolina]|uniref:Uncharacterized protein n=1 Tax=Macrophomina phaseolina TaxID=35725 RepID=A0ABQ8GCN4_9PEZI|nr:hypothetical protein B0J12DRAFT_100758 [Macrophomina phaseolina]
MAIGPRACTSIPPARALNPRLRGIPFHASWLQFPFRLLVWRGVAILRLDFAPSMLAVGWLHRVTQPSRLNLRLRKRQAMCISPISLLAASSCALIFQNSFVDGNFASLLREISVHASGCSGHDTATQLAILQLLLSSRMTPSSRSSKERWLQFSTIPSSGDTERYASCHFPRIRSSDFLGGRPAAFISYPLARDCRVLTSQESSESCLRCLWTWLCLFPCRCLGPNRDNSCNYMQSCIASSVDL